MLRHRLLSIYTLIALALVANDAPSQPVAKDLHGDPLPAGAVARLGTVRWRHAGLTTFAAFRPDGKAVLSAADDNTIHIWEYPSGKELRRIDPPVVDAGPGKSFPPTFPGTLSPDGKTVAVCYSNRSNEVHIIEVATGKDLQTLKLPLPNQWGISKLAFSPDGQQLAVLGSENVKDMRISIWDWAKAKELRTFAYPRGKGEDYISITHTLLWSPDGTALSTMKVDADNKKPERNVGLIQLWDPATGKELRSIAIPAVWYTGIRGLVFSPDGKMLALTVLSAPTARSIVVVDMATDTLRTWKHNFGRQPLLLFGRDSTKLYGCANFSVVEWDAQTGKELRKLDSVSLIGDNVTPGDNVTGVSAGWSPDGKSLVLAGGNNALKFIDVATLKWVAMGSAWAFPLSAMQFTPDGKHLFCVRSGIIYKWDAVTGKQLGSQEIPFPSSEGKHASRELLSPEGQALWVTLYAGYALGFTNPALEKIGPLPGVIPDGPILFSPDGKMLAVRQRLFGELGQPIDGGTIRLFEVPTGKLLHTSAVDGFDVGGTGFGERIMFFAPDSNLLAAFADAQTLAVWDTASGQRIASLRVAPPTKAAIHSGAFSPDGRCVVLDQNDGTVALYELASGQVRRTYGTRVAGKEVGGNQRTPQEKFVVFGKDGRTLLHAGLDGVVHVWDVAGGKELAAFEGHSGAINCLALAPDGKTLASASADTTALHWDLTRVKRPAPAGKPLTKAEREACWEALLTSDAAKAWAAMGDLVAAPKDAVAWIKDRVKPAMPLDMKHVDELIVQLDDKQFKVRDQASGELLKLGEQFVPVLDKALAAKPPLEASKRLESLRGKMTGMVLHDERLRAYRAVEVLERIGTPAARQVLQTLADGTPGALITTSAQAALKR